MTKTPTEVVCSGCFRLVDLVVGKIVAGWERVRFVSPTPGGYLCEPCKDPIIDGLAKALPL